MLATCAVFSVLLFDPHPIHAAHVFYDHTIGFQTRRSSPFSIWDWRQFHASGIPDLHLEQRVLEALVALAAAATYFVPRHKTPLQLAALTAFLLVAVQFVMTHWFYLYIPWFFPFAAVAFLTASPQPDPVEALAPEPARHPVKRLRTAD